MSRTSRLNARRRSTRCPLIRDDKPGRRTTCDAEWEAGDEQATSRCSPRRDHITTREGRYVQRVHPSRWTCGMSPTSTRDRSARHYNGNQARTCIAPSTPMSAGLAEHKIRSCA